MKMTREEKNWVLYDVGNSAFVLLVSTILPLYFNYLAQNAGLSDSDYLAYWGYAASIATIIVAVMGPVLGTMADTKGFKKLLFTVSMLVGAAGCIALGLAKQWLIFLGIFIIAKTGLALLVTQFVAFPSAIFFGKLSKRFKTEKLILVCISAYLFIAVFAIFLATQLQFWILAVLVGMFQGGVQALSRSYFAKIIPSEQAGEYFGLMDICGKGAAFLGTTVVGIVTQLTGSMSKGVGMISVFFVLGIVFFNMAISADGRKKAADKKVAGKASKANINDNYKYPIDIV